MTTSPDTMVECRVVGGENLPAASGGSAAFCAALKRAAAAQIPGSRFTVVVKVKGPSLMTATITTSDGRTLPEQTFSISDRTLTRGSLEHFADSLAGEAARAASR